MPVEKRWGGSDAAAALESVGIVRPTPAPVEEQARQQLRRIARLGADLPEPPGAAEREQDRPGRADGALAEAVAERARRAPRRAPP